MRRAFWLSLIPAAASAVPVQVAHQGRLVDASGAPVTGTQSVRIGLYAASTGGVAVHEETRSVTAEDGYYQVVLGTGGDLDHTELSGTLFVEVALGSTTFGPRQTLTWAPRAAVAESSRRVEPGTVGATRIDNGQLVLGAAAGSTCSPAGTLGFDSGKVRVCVGTSWVDLRFDRPILYNGTTRTYSDGTVATSCRDYLERNEPGHKYEGDIGDGVYRIDPDGATTTIPAFDVFCDMTTDGGGWTLIHKTDESSAADRTDAGANTGALLNASINTVAILPRTTIAAIGSTYRVQTVNGRKLFWQLPGLYRTTESGSINYGNTPVKLSWAAAWGTGNSQTSGSHGTCIASQTPFGGEHICIERWCCNGGAVDGDGIWVNGGSWPAQEEAGSGWVR